MVDELEGPFKKTTRPDPVFILGLPRTASKWIMHSMNAFSECCVIHELHIHRLWRRDNDRLIKEVVNNSPGDTKVDQLMELIKTRKLIGPYWRLEGSDYTVFALEQNELRNALSQVEDGKSMLQAMLEAHRLHHGKHRKGARHPTHFFYLPRLFQWYPESRVVFLVRPIADIAKSWVRKRVSDHLNPFFSLLMSSAITVHTYLNALLSKPLLWRWRKDPRVLVISYPELIEQPSRIFRQICDHFELEYDPRMADNTTVFDSSYQPGDPRYPG